MKNLKIIIGIACFLFPSLLFSNWWDSQQKGTTFNNNIENEGRFRAAKTENIDFVRLMPNNWVTPTQQIKGNFLIGEAENKLSVPIKDDVVFLKTILNMANRQNIKVILVLPSLPYLREGNTAKDGIWYSEDAQNQTINFWKELVLELNDHPAVAAVQILYKPFPEESTASTPNWENDQEVAQWYQSVEGTTADISLFYQKAVSSIREANTSIPIIVESGYRGNPNMMKYLKPITHDSNIIYSFNMYYPIVYTSQKSSHSYPGSIPTGISQQAKDWNKDTFNEFLTSVKEFQVTHKIPSNRIMVSEFAVNRTNSNASAYIQDSISVFNSNNWHWAFFKFRPDNDPDYDYELGTSSNVDFQYWDDISKQKIPERVYAKAASNPIWNVIQEGLKD